MAIKLGVKVQDRITGFTGVVTGRCEYLTGCHQVLVCPPVDTEGKASDSRWFDEQRCKVLDANPISLDNGATPGCDIPAPVR